MLNTQADLGTMMSTIPFQPFYDKNDQYGFAPVASGTFMLNPLYDADAIRLQHPLSANPTPEEISYREQLVSTAIALAKANGEPDSVFDGDPAFLGASNAF